MDLKEGEWKEHSNPAHPFLHPSILSGVQAKARGPIDNFSHIIDYFKPREIAFTNDQFAGFVGVAAPIERLGKPSNNGFINVIPYERQAGGYKTYAVLKSSLFPQSDNLMYEYMVGQYVNKLNKRFPCFVETYGYYNYTDERIYQLLKTTRNIYNLEDISAIKSGLKLQDEIDYAVACENSDHLAILIQYLPIKSIHDKLKDKVFLKNELANVLFQVYMPLSVLADSFTHYDLHDLNVNVCKPAEDSYIEFHYHMDDGKEYKFKSKYIAKMIDYGRSYFNDEEASIDSEKIHKEICKKSKCKPECGKEKGFAWMEVNPDPSKSFWISSQKRNKSHDLRLLNEVNRHISEKDKNEILSPQLQYILSNLKYDQKFGTPESQNGYPDKIKNVHDAAKKLGQIISFPSTIESNEAAYFVEKKIGDLHIYCTATDSTNMKFIAYQEKGKRTFAELADEVKTRYPEHVFRKRYPHEIPERTFADLADEVKTRYPEPVIRKRYPPEFPDKIPTPAKKITCQRER